MTPELYGSKTKQRSRMLNLADREVGKMLEMVAQGNEDMLTTLGRTLLINLFR